MLPLCHSLPARSSSQKYIVISLSDKFSCHSLCDAPKSCSMRAGHIRDRRMFVPTKKERSEKSVFKCYVGSASHPRAENMFSFSQRWGQRCFSLVVKQGALQSPPLFPDNSNSGLHWENEVMASFVLLSQRSNGSREPFSCFFSAKGELRIPTQTISKQRKQKHSFPPPCMIMPSTGSLNILPQHSCSRSDVVPKR